MITTLRLTAVLISPTASDPLDGTSADITGISVSGNSTVTLNGHSTIDTNTVVGARCTGAGQQRRLLILGDDSVVDVNVSYIPTGYYTYNALLMADGEGTSIENKGDITSHGVYSVIRADNGSEVSNSGDILVYATSSNSSEDRAAITRASGEDRLFITKPAAISPSFLIRRRRAVAVLKYTH